MSDAVAPLSVYVHQISIVTGVVQIKVMTAGVVSTTLTVLVISVAEFHAASVRLYFTE